MLTELYKKACERVSSLSVERGALVMDKTLLEEALVLAQRALSDNEMAIASAIKERDSLSEALKVAPEPKERKDDDSEDMRRKRATVFMQMRQIPGSWIKPFGIAALTGLDAEEVCSILRRASKIEGIPLEHNGERGCGSMYRWVGEPINKK